MNIESAFTVLRREQLLIDHAVYRVQSQESVNSLRLTTFLEIPLNAPHIPVAPLHLLARQRTSHSQGIAPVPERS